MNAPEIPETRPERIVLSYSASPVVQPHSAQPPASSTPVSNGWTVAAKPKPDAVARLFCFSYAGTGGSAYRGWGAAAPDGLEVCAVQLPGRENRIREPAFTSLGTLADTMAEVLAPLLDRPFVFYGHSLGSIVAFETARRLRRHGVRLPVSIFVAASRAPHLPWPHPPVRHLDDTALLTEVHRRYGTVPSVILEDAELRALLTPTLRADMSLIETYRYEPEDPMAVPIVAFGGENDRMVKRPEIEAWASQTSAGFRLRMLQGDHIFLQSHRQELLDEIWAACPRNG